MSTSETGRTAPTDLSKTGLFGRDEEMAQLRAAAEASRAGTPSTILVGGDAGMGKTRLLSEFIAGTGEPVLWGGCLPLGERGVPYLPLIEMLRSLDDATRDTLPPALDVVVPRGTAEPGKATSRAHLFQAVIELLEDLAAQAPLIVVVEDLHWADRSTRDLIDFVIGLLRDQRILVVVSFRSDDLPTDHPLRSTLAEWQRRPGVTRIDLEPLSPDDGLRMIAGLLSGSGLTREQAARLVERADGNPFFLEELAAAGPDVTGPPERMRDLLLRRTHEMSPELLRLLRIASAGGTSINEELLSRVAGSGIDETRDLLRDGIRAQLLTVDHRGCRFRHALLAEALHDDLLPAERREYHASYADSLGKGEIPVRPGELAAHQAEAGRIDRALAAWVAAAEAAEAQFAFAEALDGYRSALDIWDLATDPEGDTGLDRVDLLRRLAETAFLAGEGRLACDMAGRALDEIDPASDPIRAGLIHHRLARYVRNTELFDEALGYQEKAVELIPASPATPERAEVLSGLALMHQFENRYHEAHRLSLEAIEVAESTDAMEAEIRARNTLGETVCILDDLDRGLEIIGEAYELARRTGNAHEQARSLWNMQGNRYFGGRMADFVANSEPTIAILRITQPHWIADHMIDTADALQMLGRWEEADQVVANAKQAYPMVADRLGVPELLVARGRLEEAKALVHEQGLRLIGFVGPDVTSRVVNLVNQAEIALAEGDQMRALALVEEALDRYPSLEKPVYMCQGIAIGMRAAGDLARTARIKGETEKVEEAARVGERLHARLVEKLDLPGPDQGWKRPVGCLAAQCDAELSRLHGQPDPTLWTRAKEHWDDLAMPYRAAYCDYRWAEDALATGVERASVEQVVRGLSDLLADLGAKLLHNEVKALARRARIDVGERFSSDRYGLTDREREVLAQLAGGSTNRQIAEALFISEKTASVHVSNILRKLTAANRGEAAATAIREGLVDMADLGRSD